MHYKNENQNTLKITIKYYYLTIKNDRVLKLFSFPVVCDFKK